MQSWHRERRTASMRVGNFCLHKFHMRQATSSESIVAPAEFLSLFKECNRLRRDGTPIKSCLKTSAKKSIQREILSFCCFTRPRPTRKPAARITFSPYNEVGALHSKLFVSHLLVHAHSCNRPRQLYTGKINSEEEAQKKAEAQNKMIEDQVSTLMVQPQHSTQRTRSH